MHFSVISTSSGVADLVCFHTGFMIQHVLRVVTTAYNFLSLIQPAVSEPDASASLLSDPPGPHITLRNKILPWCAPAPSYF